MRKPTEQITFKNHTIKIFQDEDARSPREDDNIGKMVCFHRRYELGDKHNYDSSDFENWQQLSSLLEVEENAVIVLPIYMYDRSGITISTGSFRGIDPGGWDSGMIGFIYCTQKDLDENFDGDVDRAEAHLKAEIKEYDDYLRGNVYGFEIENSKGDFIDSCWGFYGDGAMEEAKDVVKHTVRRKTIQHTNYLKKVIKSRVPIIYRKSLQL